jgi:predicted transcriptional regulator
MPTAETTPKARLLQAIQDLPDDSTYEEILRELAFARMIERGLADSEAGRTISHEEMGQRIASWAKGSGPPKPSCG